MKRNIEGLAMKPSHLRSLTINMGLLLCLSYCAREEIKLVSSAQLPITTESTVALGEFQEGMRYANTLQRVEAAKHFRLAVEADPTFATAWLNLAYVSPGTAGFVSNLDSAKHYAESASEGEQQVILAAHYGFMGNNTQQEKTLKKLVEMFPGDASVHLLMGNFHFGLRQYHEAIQSYQQATKFDAELAILHNQLGYSQRALGNYGESEKAFKLYIRLNPENPNAYDSYAELLMEMGRFKESIEFYAKALEKDPHFIASHIGIACNYAFLGEPEKGRKQLEVMKDLARNNNDTRRAFFTEAMTYVCEGDLELAIETIRGNFTRSQAALDVGNMANDLVTLGNLQLEADLFEDAESSFMQSMSVIDVSDLPQGVKDNAHSTHHANMARLHAARGEFSLAKLSVETFAAQVLPRKNPIQIKLISRLNGIIALQQKEFKIAIQELSKADQLNPYNLYRIGEAYAGLGDLAQANNYKLQAQDLNVLNSMDQAIVLSKTKFSKQPS